VLEPRGYFLLSNSLLTFGISAAAEHLNYNFEML
jgi:hypothetical protein